MELETIFGLMEDHILAAGFMAFRKASELEEIRMEKDTKESGQRAKSMAWGFLLISKKHLLYSFGKAVKKKNSHNDLNLTKSPSYS